MVRLLRRIAKFLLLPLLVLLLLTLICLFGYRSYRQVRNREQSRILAPAGVDTSYLVSLGREPQWIFIRGHTIQNPVLLFLHGGPGSPETPLVRHYNQALEKHFTVVTWEQRGAGKSFRKGIADSTMRLDQFVEDTHSLVGLLKERFGQEKIYLMGHSWGSILGMHTIDRYPEDFYAYIGVGQVVDMEQNEKLSYDYCLQEAYKQANTTAVRELQTLGPPRKGAYRTGLEGLLLQRKWLTNLGGSLHGKSDLYGVLQHVLTAYEYSAGDLLGYAQGALFSLERLWPQILTVDLFRQVPAVTVPVFFCAGRNDYQTPAVLVKQYYHQLQAPHKELIWFEQSAHSPLFEEPEKFNVLLIDRILPQTLGSTHYSKNRRAYQLTGEK